MLDYEFKYYSNKIKYIAGCDEAGRGPICGPVVAAAVIFPKDYNNENINDSKKLTEKERNKLVGEIKNNALAYAVSIISPSEIDKINILEASRKAMLEALKNLDHKYDLVISDYMKLPNQKCEVIPLVKADAKCLCVAAASILAKVTRDEIMNELDKQYPNYCFKKHKGYPTKLHLEILKKYGPIKGIYRYSYKPVKDLEYEQLKFL